MMNKKQILREWNRMSGEEITASLNEYFKKQSSLFQESHNPQRVKHPFEKEMDKEHEKARKFEEIFADLAE